MSDSTEQQAAAQQAAPVDKGKGKAVEPSETEDESSDDEMHVCLLCFFCVRGGL
jgi:hypothetical protein